MATSGAGKVSWVEAPAPKAEEMAVQYDGQMRIAFDAFDAGRYTEAVAHFNAAAELCAKMPKHDTASSAWVARRVKAMNNSAASKDKLGELEAAERGYAAARKVLLDAYASYSFPSLWDSSYSAMLAHVEKKMGMMPRTVGAHVGEGVDVGEVVDVGKHMAHEAVAAFKAKEYERALPLLEQAIAILEKHGRGDAITLATCINNLASTHMELGNAEPARRNYIRALQVPGTTEAQRTHMQGKLKQLNARLAGAGRGGEVQRALQSELAALVKEKGCGPILIRLSWHDAGVFAEGKGGCPNAAMRFAAEGEGAFGANAGLPDVALGLLAPLTAKYVEGQKVISHADMWALAANVAIEAMGGPHVPTRFGRQDAASAAESVEGQAGRLPDGDKGAAHLREIFGPKGFGDQAIVALSGAHTVGRCHANRSGFDGPWTEQPLKFDNSYFVSLLRNAYQPEKTAAGCPQHRHAASGTIMLESDLALVSDPAFKPHVERYAADQSAFFADFVEAWVMLQELGCTGLRDAL